LATASKQLNPVSLIGTVDAGVAAANAYIDGVQAHTETIRTIADSIRTAPGPIGPSGPTAGVLHGYRAWADTYGTWGDQDERYGKMGYEWNTFGGVVGFDRIFGNTILGASFGYSETDVEADKYTEADIDTCNFGIYGTYTKGNFWIDSGASYAWGDINTDRKVNFLGKVASGETDSHIWSGYSKIGYDFYRGNWTITPSAMLKYSYYEQDAYTEKGAAGANLSVRKFDQDSLKSILGLSLSYKIKERLSAKFRASWVHEYYDNQSIVSASFANAQAFKSEGLDPADDSGVFGFGIEGMLRENITAYIDYDYELKQDFNAHNITVGMRIGF
jgi:outer membrane autotransporter protein